TGLEELPKFLRGRVVQSLILDGTDFDDEMIEDLANHALVDRLSIRETRVTRAGAVAYKQAHPTCPLDSDFGEFPPEHCLPGEADAIPVHEQMTWQRAREIVESFGGTITIGTWGSNMKMDHHLEIVPNGVPVEIRFWGQADFNDAAARDVVDALVKLPDFECRSLALVGTSLTPDGLMEFEPIKPVMVQLGQSPVSMTVDSIAKQISTWPTGTWEFNECIGANGLATFAANGSSGIVSFTTTNLSPSAVKVIADSKVTSLGIIFEGRTIDDYIPVMQTWTGVNELKLIGCPKPTDQQVLELQTALPNTAISWDFKPLSSPAPEQSR
ncbi:MAG: hypothetical protein AAF670_18095, partial [Planctomycetota bacterium]